MNIALSGLRTSTARCEDSAKRVVSDKNADLAAELVTQKMAEADFRADLAVVRAAGRMTKSLLDILA